MFKITLNGVTKEVPYVTALALRELKEPMEILTEAERRRMSEDENERDKPLTTEQMDTVVSWFCLFLQRAFTPEEIYKYYDCDQLLQDALLCAMTVQRRVTAALQGFHLPLAGKAQETASEA